MAVTTYTKSGSKSAVTTKLDKSVFGLEVNDHELLKSAYVAYLANGRVNLAVTKTRGKVSGGGKKPWRQKGTGRARFGSSRVPIWRGGGITFGPTGNENYTHKLNVKAKRQALRQALSLASSSGKISIIEAFESKEGKVKATITLLDKVGAKGRVLLVVEDKNALIERATANLPMISVTQAGYLNVYDVLNADTILITSKSLDIVNDWLASAKPAVKKTETAS